jgi:hypothetical protein
MADLSGYVPALGRGVTISAADMAANTITSTQVATSLVQYVSVSVTSAQILAFGTTNVQILPSSGSGFAYVVSDIAVDISGGTAYAAGGTVSFFYGTGTATLLAGSIASAAFAGTTGTTVYLAGSTSGYQVFPNAVISMGTTGSTAFTTGNETATVNIWYATIPTLH